MKYKFKQFKPQMIKQRRGVKSYKQILVAYDESCSLITSRYSEQMERLTENSIKAYYQMFNSYLLRKRIDTDDCQNTKAYSTQQSTQKANSKMNDCKNYPKNGATDIKGPIHYEKERQDLLVQKQIQDLSLDSSDEQELELNEHKNKNEYFSSNKGLVDMIIESQQKAKKHLQQDKINQPTTNYSDSEYQLTDYSSNQSSNDINYSPYYSQEQENQPLFGSLFLKQESNQSNSNTNLLSFSFSNKQLLKSPKKMKGQRRLFVGQKKVPRWAEDLQEIKRLNDSQNIDYATNKVFGSCVVENLNTNLIFQKPEAIKRTSSAKWVNKMFVI